MYTSSEVFNDKKVVDISEETTKKDLTSIASLIRIEPESGQTFEQCFDLVKSHQDFKTMDTLVVGNWLEEYGAFDNVKMIFDLLEKRKADLPALKALFVGDIAQEESEISWIEMFDLSTFIESFSNLTYFRVRGDGRFLKNPIKHKNLTKLAFETGGLDKEVLTSLSQSEIPELTTLEIWLGSDEYGSVGKNDINDFVKNLSTQFPKLRTLALRNAELADDVAIALAENPILSQLETLDLSLGALTNKGAQALLDSSLVSQLKKLDIHFHFVENEELLKALQKKVAKVDVSDKQEADVYDDDDDEEIYRYIFVSE